MREFDAQYNQLEAKTAAAGLMAGTISLTERTKSEISRLEIQLDRKKELLALLERNPDTQRVIELMSNY